MQYIGGAAAILGLVAMASDVEGLYAAVKALVCVVKSNPLASKEMERIKGYQVCNHRALPSLYSALKKKIFSIFIIHIFFKLWKNDLIQVNFKSQYFLVKLMYFKWEDELFLLAQAF